MSALRLSTGAPALGRIPAYGTRRRRATPADAAGASPPACEDGWVSSDGSANHGCHLVLGDEQLLVERAVSEIASAARPAGGDAEVTKRRVGELTAAELTELLSPTLFGDSRVVVLEAAEEADTETATAISAQAARKAEDLTLVVVHSGGGRAKAAKALPEALRGVGASVTEVPRVTRPAQREEFVRNEARRAGARIDQAATAALLEVVGSDLRELAAAAAQLAADTGGTVDEQAVRRYHTGKAEVTGFTVAEKCVAGDAAGTLEALRWALQLGVAPVLIADALAEAVRGVARVSVAGTREPKHLAGELGMPPWKVKKTLAQARGWHQEGLASALRTVATVNADVKGAAADPEYALERAARAILSARRD
jgi:DNA polymerase-3 subunit delta